MNLKSRITKSDERVKPYAVSLSLRSVKKKTELKCLDLCGEVRLAETYSKDHGNTFGQWRKVDDPEQAKNV